jgi:hypothetical protein
MRWFHSRSSWETNTKKAQRHELPPGSRIRVKDVLGGLHLNTGWKKLLPESDDVFAENSLKREWREICYSEATDCCGVRARSGVERCSRSETQSGILATLLDLHCGLLDHAEDVRVSAMNALQEIAKRTPKPIKITPVMLLSDFLFSFTASSRVAVYIFQFLVQLDTPEAHQAMERALLRVQRNEDFSAFVGILQHANRLEVLRRLELAKLSKTKAAVVRSALHSGNYRDR